MPSRISSLARQISKSRPHIQPAIAPPQHPLVSHRIARGHGSFVNTSEISHFDTLAAEWWDPHGSSRLLHLMNPLRHQFIRGCLQYDATKSSPSAKLRYLDVGCGGGIFAESAARLPTTESVIGLDASSGVIEVARKHAQNDPMLMTSGKLTYQLGGIESLPEAADDEKFDIVSVFEVLEHVNRPNEFLKSCLSHVKPGGWIVLSTINRTWTSWFTTKLVAEELWQVVPRGTHDWNKYIKPEEVSQWFAQESGWDSQRVMGVVFVPGLGWREVAGSEGYGNYFFAARRSP